VSKKVDDETEQAIQIHLERLESKKKEKSKTSARQIIDIAFTEGCCK